MLGELQETLSNNRQGPLRNREGTFLSRDDAKSRARAHYGPPEIFFLFDCDSFNATEYLLESAALGNFYHPVGDIPKLGRRCLEPKRYY